MLLPSLMNGNIFDNWMKEFPAGIANRENFFRNASAGEIMKTDVKETETGYDVEIDLPGFKKEEVTAKLDDGYLVISACRSKNSDEKDEEGKYIPNNVWREDASVITKNGMSSPGFFRCILTCRYPI